MSGTVSLCDRFAGLREIAARLENVPVAVVWAVDASSLLGALKSVAANLIAPVLVGPKEQICADAMEESLSDDTYEIVAVPTPEDAAQKSVAMAVSWQVRGLMKGALHSNSLMHAFVMEKAMRTGRRMRHVLVPQTTLNWSRLKDRFRTKLPGCDDDLAGGPFGN